MVSQSKNILMVYLHNQHVGKLYTDHGILNFSYEESYLKKPDAVKISVSLPLQKEAFSHSITSSFFSGLLPDEDVRRRLAKSF